MKVLICDNCELPAQCLAGGQCVEREIDRIMSLSDEEIIAEHLAQYGGNQKLADKALDMTQATIQAAIGRTIKH